MLTGKHDKGKYKYQQLWAQKPQFNWTFAGTLAHTCPGKTDFVISISRAVPLTLLIMPNSTCLTIFRTAIDCTIILINDKIWQIRALISWLRVLLVISRKTLIWRKERGKNLLWKNDSQREYKILQKMWGLWKKGSDQVHPYELYTNINNIIIIQSLGWVLFQNGSSGSFNFTLVMFLKQQRNLGRGVWSE